MDLKALKLELLERIALLDDEARLLALKRLLDAPRHYGPASAHLNVVSEGAQQYVHVEDRSYSAEEVRGLVEDLRRSMDVGTSAPLLDAQERAELDADREAYLRGEGRNYTVEETLEILKRDLQG